MVWKRQGGTSATLSFFSLCYMHTHTEPHISWDLLVSTCTCRILSFLHPCLFSGTSLLFLSFLKEPYHPLYTDLLTLSVHVQRGLQYLFCVSVCTCVVCVLPSPLPQCTVRSLLLRKIHVCLISNPHSPICRDQMQSFIALFFWWLGILSC